MSDAGRHSPQGTFDGELAGLRDAVALQQEPCRFAAGATFPDAALQVQGIAIAGCIAMTAANTHETTLGSPVVIPVTLLLQFYAHPAIASKSVSLYIGHGPLSFGQPPAILQPIH